MPEKYGLLRNYMLLNSCMYRVFYYETLTAKHEPFHIQNEETNSNTEFLQPYLTVAPDVLLEIDNSCTFRYFVTLVPDKH
jgi:hypothetical protein